MPVNDRIFSTSIDLSYTFSPVPLSPPQDEKKLSFAVPQGSDLVGGVWDGDGVAERVRRITLQVFAMDESASVQVCAGLRNSVRQTDQSGPHRQHSTRWPRKLSQRTPTLPQSHIHCPTNIISRSI